MYYLIHDIIMTLHKEFIYLHGFSDTSKLVYRACVYTESVFSAGNASFILTLIHCTKKVWSSKLPVVTGIYDPK